MSALRLGKVPNDLLKSIIFGRLGVEDRSVILGPSVGEDAALIRLGREIVAFKSDPITGSVDEVGQLAIYVNANDIATRGAVPRWFLQCILMPEGFMSSDLAKICEQIDKAAKEWDFEKAREKRERYHALKRLVEKQHVHEHLGKNRDVWAVLREERKLRIVLLSFRRGVLISKRSFREPFSLNPDGAFSSFIFQYYTRRQIPDEIIISEALEDLPLLEQHLREKRPGLRVLGPESRGAGDMIKLAVENLHEVEPIKTDEAFKRTLHLKKVPKRIEVYDISHTGGTGPSGIMVVFEEFKARKDAYRVFHIREAQPDDDVAMMSEVLRRRMNDEKIRPSPDLVILDGGKGQLSAAISVFKALSMSPDLIGIAKGQGRKRMEDVLYLPFRKNPLLLPKSSPVFKEMVRMRDEAHRFAIASHKKWKRREDLASILPHIKGVGKKRMMLLLKTFPSLHAMREADADLIARLPGFNRKIAEEIKTALHLSS